jgi:hypothetical protein
LESAVSEALKFREGEPRSPALARFWDVLVSKADGNRCQTIFRASPRRKIDEQDIGVFSGAVEDDTSTVGSYVECAHRSDLLEYLEVGAAGEWPLTAEGFMQDSA